MRGFTTIIENRNSEYVRCNGLLVPFPELAPTLRNFVEPAVYFSPEVPKPFDFSLSGSLTKIRFGNRHFGVTTQHQRMQFGVAFDHCQLGILNYQTQAIVSSGMAVGPADEGLDLVLYDFSQPVASGNLSKHGWYGIGPDVRATPPADIVMAIGYPSELNEIDYSKQSLGASPFCVYGEMASPSTNARLTFTTDCPMESSPSGMSGGSVFGVAKSMHGTYCFLAGILTNASRSRFHFVPSALLSPVLQKALAT